MPSKEEWKEIGKIGHKLIFAFTFILILLLIFSKTNTNIGESVGNLLYNMALAGENMVVEFLELFGIEAERRVADSFRI